MKVTNLFYILDRVNGEVTIKFKFGNMVLGIQDIKLDLALDRDDDEGDTLIITLDRLLFSKKCENTIDKLKHHYVLSKAGPEDTKQLSEKEVKEKYKI